MDFPHGTIAAALAAVLTVAALAYAAGRSSRPHPIAAAVVDTVEVAPAEMLERLQDLELERAGLRARLEGVHARAPERIVVTDTIVREAPDTVFVALRMDGGEISAGRLDRIRTDSVAGWRPTLPIYDARGCDDGWSLGVGGFRCDPARLGHLRLLLSASAALPSPAPFAPELATPALLAEAGLAWEPSYRSGTRVLLTYGSDGAWRVQASVAPELSWPF